ncbi:SCP-2 sterol transfer family protein [Haloechinothrix alba]|uniref:SCP-2 sterol transfer family protein n=1 Tax=Haloechinothrix alba TaxID=664784 RepID=A0A239AKZ5_9PSEU|nr:SCP2 sterol-binding domain-containing protein [Haloechinothrix alba]SNR96219.1 SCP-2 sterol transfer family protein [Haloechinothrix alba]
MAGFASEDELYKYVGAIFEKAFEDKEIGPKLAETNAVLAMYCTEPDSTLIIDMGNHKVHEGNTGPAPDAAMRMTTETSNLYWQGKVNLTFAMARGKVKVEGNIAKLLALSPASRKMFPVYVEMLKADGRDDLLA